MRQLQFILIVHLTGCLLLGCSATTSNPATSPSAQTSSSSDSSYTGNSSFSYTIGNRKVSIKDVMHNGDGKNHMALFLNEVSNDAANGIVKINVTNELTSEVFNFSITNSGRSLLHYMPNLANFINKKAQSGIYMSPKYKNYYADSVVVNITQIDDKHVAGTFSGKFLSDEDKTAVLEISEGSFDVVYKGKND